MDWIVIEQESGMCVCNHALPYYMDGEEKKGSSVTHVNAKL